MRSLMLALQFMTIIPVRVKGLVTEEEMAKSALYFPVVGIVQGLIAAGSSSLFLILFPAEIAGALVIVLMTLINGGFHLDGLMDTADALAVKSSGNTEADREKRLSVMKDSRSGAIGVVAVVILLLLKYECIVSLLTTDVQLVFFMPVMPKWAMVLSLYYGKPARNHGLGKIFADGLGRRELAGAALFLAVSLIFFHTAAGAYLPGNGYLLYGILVTAVSAFSLMSVFFFSNRFGGITGDTLGATGEVSEILSLLVIIPWSRLSI